MISDAMPALLLQGVLQVSKLNVLFVFHSTVMMDWSGWSVDVDSGSMKTAWKTCMLILMAEKDSALCVSIVIYKHCAVLDAQFL